MKGLKLIGLLAAFLLLGLSITAVVLDTMEMYALIGVAFVTATLLLAISLAIAAVLAVISAVITLVFLKMKETIKKKAPKCYYRGEYFSFNRLRRNLMKDGYTKAVANRVAKLYIVK